MGVFKKLVKKAIFKEKCDSDTYIAYLRKIGCKVGENCRIYNPQQVLIDITRPWLIDIGDNVELTYGVTILTHGYDWAVLKGVYGEVLGSAGGVEIGSNVFIGMHTTILKGVHIGNNVIIGANSLVNRDIPDNCVAAGNPCKVIMSLEEYYQKRKALQVEEAKELVQLYRQRYGKEPDEDALREFFWLFSNDPDDLPDAWKSVNNLGGNGPHTSEVMREHKKQFNSVEEFLNSI